MSIRNLGLIRPQQRRYLLLIRYQILPHFLRSMNGGLDWVRWGSDTRHAFETKDGSIQCLMWNPAVRSDKKLRDLSVITYRVTILEKHPIDLDLECYVVQPWQLSSYNNGLLAAETAKTKSTGGHPVQGSAKGLRPGCVNNAGKLRQEW